MLVGLRRHGAHENVWLLLTTLGHASGAHRTSDCWTLCMWVMWPQCGIRYGWL